MSLPGDGILEWRIWRKVNRIMKKACLFIWHIDQSLQLPCKKSSGARKHLSGNKRRWLVYHTSQWSTGNKKHDWPASRRLAVRCSIGSVALPIVGDSWVLSVRVSIATQLNSTSSWVELSCAAINGPLDSQLMIVTELWDHCRFQFAHTTVYLKRFKNS